MSPARSVLNDALPPRVGGCRTHAVRHALEGIMGSNVQTRSHGSGREVEPRRKLDRGARGALIRQRRSQGSRSPTGCPDVVRSDRARTPLRGWRACRSARAVSLGAAHLPAGKQVSSGRAGDRAPSAARPAVPGPSRWAGLALAVPAPVRCRARDEPRRRCPRSRSSASSWPSWPPSRSTSTSSSAQQSFSWSPSELAFVAGPGRGRRRLDGRRPGARRRRSSSPSQGYPRPKAAFNVGVVVLEVCAAVGVLRVLPGR